MNVVVIDDKSVLEKHFRKNTDINLYSIGDLDDFFWKYTKWYGLKEGDDTKEIVLVYSGTDLPVLLALYSSEFEYMKLLLENMKQDLPQKFYSHLSPGLINVFQNSHKFEAHGKHLKMSIRKSDSNYVVEDENIKRLCPEDFEQLKKLYDESYPGNWFDKRMLETGKYFGYFVDGAIAGVAGIHVYSEKYRVASLGNITTSPLHRGKSICKKLTAALCHDLFKTCDNVGLNVHAENESAIRSYKQIGFEIVGEYEEYSLIED